MNFGVKVNQGAKKSCETMTCPLVQVLAFALGGLAAASYTIGPQRRIGNR
jgi:hypothetical protein